MKQLVLEIIQWNCRQILFYYALKSHGKLNETRLRMDIRISRTGFFSFRSTHVGNVNKLWIAEFTSGVRKLHRLHHPVVRQGSVFCCIITPICNVVPWISNKEQTKLWKAYKFTRSFYRPQTKFAKVMFSQMSVCPQGGLCPGEVSVQGGLCWERVLCLGGLCPRGVSGWVFVRGGGLRAGGTHPTGMHSCFFLLSDPVVLNSEIFTVQDLQHELQHDAARGRLWRYHGVVSVVQTHG